MDSNQLRSESFNENNDVCSYEEVEKIAHFLLDRVPFKPKVGIICGTGLGSIAESLKNPIKIPYDNIPNFPVSTVKGHVGQLVFGYINDTPIMCMQGRFHYYEGYPLWKCTMPIRVMKMMGATHLIVSNAAGGINEDYKVGDIMIVNDHINMMGFSGNNPLRGPNDDRFGPRFLNLTNAYDTKLITAAKKIAVDEGFGDLVHDGVLTCLGGPNLETVAELRMFGLLGADAVGMSNVHEVITAVHCNMTVLAFSLITNLCNCTSNSPEDVDHEKVLDVGKMREDVLKRFIFQVVTFISNNA